MRHLGLILATMVLMSCTAEVIEEEPPNKEEVIGYVDEWGTETPILKGNGVCDCRQTGIDDDCYYEWISPLNACWLDRYDDDYAYHLLSAGIRSDGAEIDLYCGFDTPYDYMNGSDELSIRVYGEATYGYVTATSYYRSQTSVAFSWGNCALTGGAGNCRLDGINPSTTYAYWGIRVNLPWYYGYSHGVDGFRVCYDND